MTETIFEKKIFDIYLDFFALDYVPFTYMQEAHCS